MTPAPSTAPDPLRVTSGRFTVKAGRHGWIVGWLPHDGGWHCAPHGLTRPCPNPRACEHITAVLAAITTGGEA